MKQHGEQEDLKFQRGNLFSRCLDDLQLSFPCRISRLLEAENRISLCRALLLGIEKPGELLLFTQSRSNKTGRLQGSQAQG